MVSIPVKLFGSIKTLVAGSRELPFDAPDGARVKDLLAFLEQRYPTVADLVHKKKVLVSVNQEIAHEDMPLHAGDEVALLPPFAGGAEAEPAETAAVREPEEMLVRVQRMTFSIDAELDRVRARSKRIGGIVTFLGTARDRSKGHAVSGITFEHYEGMAQKKLREIRERALKDFNIIEVLILHRYGPIDIGENIVLIIVGAEHRADAFKACQWCIDELKQITPIWKLEQTPDGDVWVEEHP